MRRDGEGGATQGGVDTWPSSGQHTRCPLTVQTSDIVLYNYNSFAIREKRIESDFVIQQIDWSDIRAIIHIYKSEDKKET